MAMNDFTGNTEQSEATINAMSGMIDQAQAGFHDLRAMAMASAALVRHSETGESDEDLACATNLMHQLAEKAMGLAAYVDSVGARQLTNGGAA